MEFVRVKVYYKDEYIAERIYPKTGTQQDAIERYRKENPFADKCVLVAEDYDPNDPKNSEFFKAYARCYF